MRGEHQVVARNNLIQIKFDIRRNLTILQGNRVPSIVLRTLDLLHYLGQIYEGLRNTERKVPTWQTPGIRGSSRRSSSGR